MRDDIFVYGRDTLKARNHFLRKQDSACAICATTEAYLVVDHEHSEKGLCRGVLCDACNQALGKLKDSRENLTAAIAYLDAHGPRNEAYDDTEDWQERRVKLSEVAPRRPVALSAYDQRVRNEQIREAVKLGDHPNDVASTFAISTRRVREIAYGR